MLSVSYLVVFLAAFIAGAINSVAGGGTLVSFPALIWVGLAVDDRERDEHGGHLAGLAGRCLGLSARSARIAEVDLRARSCPASIGGILGAVLLVLTPTAVFDRLIPLLILFATVLFMLQEPVQRMIKTTGKAHSGSTRLADRRAGCFSFSSRSTAATSARASASSCSRRSASWGSPTSIR